MAITSRDFSSTSSSFFSFLQQHPASRSTKPPNMEKIVGLTRGFHAAIPRYMAE